MASRSNRVLVPQAKAGLDRFKMEAAREVGVNLKEGYNGEVGSQPCRSVSQGVECYSCLPKTAWPPT